MSYFSKRKRFLLGKRGISLIEVMASAAILGVGMVAAVRSFSISKNQMKDIRIQKAIAQVESELRTEMFLDAEKYLDCYMGGKSDPNYPLYTPCAVSCNKPAPATSIPFKLTHTTLKSGISLSAFDTTEAHLVAGNLGWPPLTQSGELNASTMPYAFEKMAQACWGLSTLYKNGGNGTLNQALVGTNSVDLTSTSATLNDVLGPNIPGFYFCVAPVLVTSAPSSLPYDNVSGMAPFLIQFQFTPLNAVSGKPLVCSSGTAGDPDVYQNALANNERIGMLNYTMYWQSQDAKGPVVGTKSSTFVSGIQ